MGSNSVSAAGSFEIDNVNISSNNTTITPTTTPSSNKLPTDDDEPTPILSSTPTIPSAEDAADGKDTSLLHSLPLSQEEDRTLIQLSPSEQKMEKSISHLFQVVGQLTEEVKVITKNTADIPTVLQSLQSFEGWIKGEIASISGRVLVNEGEVEKLHSKTNSLSTKVNSLVKQMEDNDNKMVANSAELVVMNEKLTQHLATYESEGSPQSFYFDSAYVEETVTAVVNREFEQANSNLESKLEHLIAVTKQQLDDSLMQKYENKNMSEVIKSKQEVVDMLQKNSAATSDRILGVEKLITKMQLKPVTSPEETITRLAALEESLKKPASIKVPAEITARLVSLENSVKKAQQPMPTTNASYEKRLMDLEESLQQIQQHPPGTKQPQSNVKSKKQVSYLGKKVTTKNIIIGDSNYMEKRIDPARIVEGEEFETFTCYTLDHVDQFLREVEFVVHPDKILLGVGTNDLDIATKDTIMPKYVELIERITSALPNSKIYVSLIFTRQNPKDKINETSRSINSELYEHCENIHRVFAFHNSNISAEMLDDPKHLDKTGKYVLLSNIRFAMFGLLPAVHHGGKGKRRGR